MRSSVIAVTNCSGAATIINSYDEYGIPGARRRRRRSAADKAAIVAERYPGVGTVCDGARRHGLASSQLSAWRRQLPAADRWRGHGPSCGDCADVRAGAG